MTINRQLVLSLSLLAGAIGGCYALSISAETQSSANSSPTEALDPVTSVATVDPDLTTVGTAVTEPIPFHLDPLDVHPRTSLTVVEQLRTAHYLPCLLYTSDAADE